MKATRWHPAGASICLAFLIGADSAPTQTNVPAPAERQFRDWLDAFNGTNRAVFLRFLETEYPARDKSDDPVFFRGLTGGLDLRKSLDSTPTRFSGLVQERDSDQFLRFDLEVESAEP